MAESSLLRLDPDERLRPDQQGSIVPNSTLTSPNMKTEIPTKTYVHSLYQSSRNRREFSLVFNDQDNEFDNNKITNLDSITVNRDPSFHNELANRKYVDDSIGEGDVLRFFQTPENYLKVSVGSDTYNLLKYDKTQTTDLTSIEYPNSGGCLLQNWVIKW